ncbi:hypothetical protein HY251_17985 [bacterium]|nr:hypothetical protein [bacterium]
MPAENLRAEPRARARGPEPVARKTHAAPLIGMNDPEAEAAPLGPPRSHGDHCRDALIQNDAPAESSDVRWTYSSGGVVTFER